jgi:hypothetical protein
MSATSLTDEFLTGLLSRLLARYGGSQVLLFGAAGEPFWAARALTKPELLLLDDALALIESLETDHLKPFVGHDARRRFVVAALDAAEDLYVVVFSDDPDRMAADARVVALRDDLRVYAEPIRRRAHGTDLP